MNIRTFTTALAMCVGITLMAQQKQPEVPLCAGNSQQTMLSIESSLIFNQAGIQLNKYNWDNTSINCHINSTVTNYKGYVNKRYLGYTTLGIGVGSFFGGLYGRSAYSGTGLNPGSTGLGAMALGVVSTSVGAYFISKAKKQKQQGDYHLNVVSQYYKDMNLY